MFKYETRVRYEDLDADGYVKPNAVIGFMQNTAVKHSAAAGYDV